jgi:DNA-binding CsgD family transcriptional regulator
MLEELPSALLEVGPDFVREVYLGTDCGVATEFAGWRRTVASGIARRHGVHDVWSINGRNWRGGGVAVFTNRRVSGGPRPNVRGLFPRIASHLAAAQRLRCRLGPASPAESAEAVLTPDGHRVEHAVGIATSRGARDALRAAAIRIDRARGKIRKSDPARALDGWKGLVAARWTLLDHFESDGRRYILARENEPLPVTPAELSARERQVLANLVLGRSNKEIAYALGLAPSTVRVLLTRAARKLRASSRAELLQRFEALSAD